MEREGKKGGDRESTRVFYLLFIYKNIIIFFLWVKETRVV